MITYVYQKIAQKFLAACIMYKVLPLGAWSKLPRDKEVAVLHMRWPLLSNVVYTWHVLRYLIWLSLSGMKQKWTPSKLPYVCTYINFQGVNCVCTSLYSWSIHYQCKPDAAYLFYQNSSSDHLPWWASLHRQALRVWGPAYHSDSKQFLQQIPTPLQSLEQ